MSETSEKEELFGKEFADGRYRVGQKLGQGGYAEVYRAHEPEIDRDVALKILRTNKQGTYSDRLRKRFLREAKLVASLTEPHTIKLYGYGEEDGLLYLAFEYVEGETLGERLEREGALKPFLVAKLLEQVLDSLQEAHDRGILHRDIKPGNIMLYEHERRGVEVKVLDFGIGKFVREQQKITQQLTAEGRLIGTPKYMSPEQMRGSDDLGPGCDLWAVGMVAYECLVGAPAVKNGDPMMMLSRIIDEDKPFQLPKELKVPQFMREMVEKLLRKDIARRYQNAAEVLRDLEEFKTMATLEMQEERLHVRALERRNEPVVTEDDEDATPAERPSARKTEPAERSEERKKRPESDEKSAGKMAAMAVGGLVLCVGVGLAVFSGDGPSEEVPAFLQEQETAASAEEVEADEEENVPSVLEKGNAQADKAAVEPIAEKPKKTKKPATAVHGKKRPVEKIEVIEKSELVEKSAAITERKRTAEVKPSSTKQVTDKAEEQTDKEQAVADATPGDKDATAPAEELPEAAEEKDESESEKPKLRIWGVE